MTIPESNKDSFAAPQSPAEEKMATLWMECFKIDKLSVHDNFFDIGGHSIMAMHLIARIRGHFQINMPIRLVFELPTVREMAEWITNQQATDSEEDK